MRPLRYSINVTLDGCVHHEAVDADEELHRYHAANLERADAMLSGRVTYQMMESAWRPKDDGSWPDWMDEWMVPWAETIDRIPKYVVSNTLESVDWNSELIQGDLGDAVRRLKEQPGKGISLGGVTLPLAIADLGLIDEFDFLIHPVIAGHGPTLFAGLRQKLDLRLVERSELSSGAVSLRYVPRTA